MKALGISRRMRQSSKNCSHCAWRFCQKTNSGTLPGRLIMKQDNRKPLPAQPSGARPHKMHIKRKLLPMAIDQDRPSITTLPVAEVMGEKVFLVPQSSDLDFPSSDLATCPRMAIAPHRAMTDPNKYMFPAWPLNLPAQLSLI